MLKSINKSDQIPAEFGTIPEKRVRAESAPPDLIGLRIEVGLMQEGFSWIFVGA